MEIVTGRAQEEYWQRAKYRDGDHPVARAYAVPKIEYLARFVELHQANILDVGCGAGLFTRILSRFSPFVIGLDCSAYMLLRNQGKLLVRGRGEELPFRSSTFDVVFGANLLHHSANPRTILREMARVSSSHVVVIEPNRLNPIMFLFSCLIREERGGLRSSKSYLTRLLGDSSLEIIQCAAMGMISQNNTPRRLVPLLKIFDRELFFGEYLVAIGKKF